MMNLIKSISIENFKGLKKKVLKFDSCYPNKITLIVGKNGSGKSSIVKFLSALNASSLKIDDNDYYEKDRNSNPPKIVFEGRYEGKDYTFKSDLSCNEIFNKYHFEIINSPVFAKDSSRFINGHLIGSAKLSTKDIEIINVKTRVENPYSLNKIKDELNADYAKYFVNLKEKLSDSFLSIFQSKYYDLRNSKRLISTIDSFLNSINCKMTRSDFDANISSTPFFNELLKNEKFSEFYEFLNQRFNNSTSTENIMNAIQLIKWNVDKKELKDYAEYLINRSLIKTIEAKIDAVNTTKRKILTIEKGNLILRLPDVNSISNGERDLLILTAKLLHILNKPYKTKQNIVVFDEIFDYFDGSNLLQFQYLLTQLIAEFKKYGFTYYFLIFTHIDPFYFQSFVIDKLLKVHYFDPAHKMKPNKILEDIIVERNCIANNSLFSDKYLHFSPNNSSESDVAASKIREEFDFFNAYRTNYDFFEYLDQNSRHYLADEEFDIIGLCLYIRIVSENIIYNMIPISYKEEFLNQHGENKYKYAEQIIEIPSCISLLRVLYNEAAHVERGNIENKKRMLYLRLSSNALKKMIEDVLNLRKS